MENDPAKQERTTRSGRKLSGISGTKRKRTDNDQTGTATKSKKRMGNEEQSITAQLANLQTFLGNKIDKCSDNVKMISERQTKSEAELANLKANTQTDIKSIRSDINSINTRLNATPKSADQPSMYAYAAKSNPNAN